MDTRDVNTRSNGHDAAGKFAIGNKLARGNPVNRRMAEMRRHLLDAIEPERVGRIGAKLAELAEAGDLDACKVLLPHLVGRPPQAIELTGPDGEPLGLQWRRVQAGILAALAPYPQAKLAVAVSLKAIIDDGATDTPDDGA